MDMEAFLKYRAEEITSGGIVVLTMPGKPDEVSYSKIPVCVMYDLIGLSLMDMAKEVWLSQYFQFLSSFYLNPLLD